MQFHLLITLISVLIVSRALPSASQLGDTQDIKDGSGDVEVDIDSSSNDPPKVVFTEVVIDDNPHGTPGEEEIQEPTKESVEEQQTPMQYTKDFSDVVGTLFSGKRGEEQIANLAEVTPTVEENEELKKELEVAIANKENDLSKWNSDNDDGTVESVKFNVKNGPSVSIQQENIPTLSLNTKDSPSEMSADELKQFANSEGSDDVMVEKIESYIPSVEEENNIEDSSNEDEDEGEDDDDNDNDVESIMEEDEKEETTGENEHLKESKSKPMPQEKNSYKSEVITITKGKSNDKENNEIIEEAEVEEETEIPETTDKDSRYPVSRMSADTKNKLLLHLIKKHLLAMPGRNSPRGYGSLSLPSSNKYPYAMLSYMRSGKRGLGRRMYDDSRRKYRTKSSRSTKTKYAKKGSKSSGRKISRKSFKKSPRSPDYPIMHYYFIPTPSMPERRNQYPMNPYWRSGASHYRHNYPSRYRQRGPRNNIMRRKLASLLMRYMSRKREASRRIMGRYRSPFMGPSPMRFMNFPSRPYQRRMSPYEMPNALPSGMNQRRIDLYDSPEVAYHAERVMHNRPYHDEDPAMLALNNIRHATAEYRKRKASVMKKRMQAKKEKASLLPSQGWEESMTSPEEGYYQSLPQGSFRRPIRRSRMPFGGYFPKIRGGHRMHRKPQFPSRIMFQPEGMDMQMQYPPFYNRPGFPPPSIHRFLPDSPQYMQEGYY